MSGTGSPGTDEADPSRGGEIEQMVEESMEDQAKRIGGIFTEGEKWAMDPKNRKMIKRVLADRIEVGQRYTIDPYTGDLVTSKEEEE